MREVKPKAKLTPNLLDRAIGYISPVSAAKRMKARLAMNMAEAYVGGSKSRRSLIDWGVTDGSADSDILPQLEDLRQRSRDLCRNDGLARGAIHTKVTSIVGTGLTLQSRLDRDVLKLDDDKLATLESQIEREFTLFCKECDIERTLNFDSLTSLAFRSVLENGDTFALLPYKKYPGQAYGTKIQLVEADRACNESYQADNETLSGGVEKDSLGAPYRYHFLNTHPGDDGTQEWTKVKAFGESGRRNVLHLYNKLRIGQSRGVPDLAPVIKSLKQLSRYREAEIMAAVVSSMFTVFIKSADGTELDPLEPSTDYGSAATDKDYKLGSGSMLSLNHDDEVEFANPSRPSAGYDPFVLAVTREIGAALEIPFEILTKHFTSSYSAARAALLEAWRFFMVQRKWLADSFCAPIYETFFTEAVLTGRISAPGFISGDPLIREAWLGAEWTGDAAGQIDEMKAINAAEKRINVGVATLSEETTALTGGDWDKKHRQRVKENNRRKEDGLIVEAVEEPSIMPDKQ